MRTHLLWLLIAGRLAMGQGQTVLSPARFLALAAGDPAVRLEQQTIDYLLDTPPALPWIDDVEIRTETHDFDLDEQEFLLRLSPNSPGQRQAQRSYTQADLQSRYQAQHWRFAQALRERYDLLLEAYYFLDLGPLQERQLAQARDKVTALREEIRRGQLDLRDLVKAEDELHELQIDSLEAERRFRATRSRINALIPAGDSLVLQPERLIPPDQLPVVLQQWSADSITSHPLLVRRQSQILLAQRAYERELADTRRVLDFVQIRYGGRNQSLFRELLSIGLAFRLPLKGNDRIDLHELEVERLEEEQNYQLLKSDFLDRSRQLKENLTDLIRQYELLLRQRQESQAAFALTQYQRSEAPPLTLLALEESVLHREEAILQLRYRLLRTYLEWLDYSGKMTAAPLVNYLSSTLERW